MGLLNRLAGLLFPRRPPFHVFFDAAPVPMLVLTPALEVVAANDAFLAVTMTDRAALVGLPLFEAFPPREGSGQGEAEAALRESAARALRGGTPDRMTVRRYDIRRPDGTYEERHWRPVNVAAGGHVLQLVEDVTGEVLRGREAVENFRLLVEGVKDYAIFMLDPQGLVRTWNAGAERINGYAAAEVVGRHFSMFYPPEASAVGWPAHVLEGARSDGRYEEEGWRVRKGGGLYWAGVAVTPLRDNAGVLTGYAKVTRDLTERKRAEDENRKLTGLLRMRLDALEAFNHSVCHDLNAPLRAMEGFAQAVVEDYDDIDPRLTEYLCRIQTACRRMRLLVSDLVRLSKVSREGLRPEVRRFDLTALAEELVALERTYPEHRRHRVTVEPGLWAHGDRDLARLLLQNLLANAFKFSRDAAAPAIEVGRNPLGEFFVRDNGVGFDPSEADRLFKPFSRLTSAAGLPGTGIGLTIAKRVADLHDGCLRGEGSPGAGAAFYFKLAPESKCDADH